MCVSIYLCYIYIYIHTTVCRFFLPLFFSLFTREIAQSVRGEGAHKNKRNEKNREKKNRIIKPLPGWSCLLLFCETTSSRTRWGGEGESVKESEEIGEERERKERRIAGEKRRKSLLDQFFCRSCNVLRGFQITRPPIKYVILQGLRVFLF